MTDDELLDRLLDLWQHRRETGRELPVPELAKHCPQLAAELQRRIEVIRRVEKLSFASEDRPRPETQG
ncbi:MAG TPA: hypothetical protein VH120_13570 [Gemmataceae bacterium]|jgi:hypothetical protein|nr:hypothetical protein [Gemmataceae bacterium]